MLFGCTGCDWHRSGRRGPQGRLWHAHAYAHTNLPLRTHAEREKMLPILMLFANPSVIVYREPRSHAVGANLVFALRSWSSVTGFDRQNSSGGEGEDATHPARVAYAPP